MHVLLSFKNKNLHFFILNIIIWFWRSAALMEPPSCTLSNWTSPRCPPPGTPCPIFPRRLDHEAADGDIFFD